VGSGWAPPALGGRRTGPPPSLPWGRAGTPRSEKQPGWDMAGVSAQELKPELFFPPPSLSFERVPPLRVGFRVLRAGTRAPRCCPVPRAVRGCELGGVRGGRPRFVSRPAGPVRCRSGVAAVSPCCLRRRHKPRAPPAAWPESRLRVGGVTRARRAGERASQGPSSARTLRQGERRGLRELPGRGWLRRVGRGARGGTSGSPPACCRDASGQRGLRTLRPTPCPRWESDTASLVRPVLEEEGGLAPAALPSSSRAQKAAEPAAGGRSAGGLRGLVPLPMSPSPCFLS